MDSFALVSRLAREVPRLSPLLAEHIGTYDEVIPHVFFGELTPFLIELKDGPDADQSVLSATLSLLDKACVEGDESVTDVINVSFLENLAGRGQLRAMQPFFGPALSGWADCLDDYHLQTPRIGWFAKLFGRQRA